MSLTLVNLDRVPEPRRSPVAQFAQRLHALAGSQLLGLSLIDPAGGATSKHPIRTAVVLAAIDLEGLRQLAAEGAQHGQQNIAVPLVFTPEFLARSCDTFPLEFLEIQHHQVLLYGEDHFSPLVFEPANVRLQCERELKTVQIALHQGLLGSGGDDALLDELDRELGHQLARTLRGLLWLKGAGEPRSPAGVVAEVEARLQRPLPGVRSVVHPDEHSSWQRFTDLYADVQALGKLIDAI